MSQQTRAEGEAEVAAALKQIDKTTRVKTYKHNFKCGAKVDLIIAVDAEGGSSVKVHWRKSPRDPADELFARRFKQWFQTTITKASSHFGGAIVCDSYDPASTVE